MSQDLTVDPVSEPIEITTPVSLAAHDILTGADPFVFKQNGKWHLLVQEDTNPTPLGHDGIRGYTIRSADTIEALPQSIPQPIKVSSQPEGLKQVWAAEIHFDKYMYVAISNGDNRTHRMHVYETEGDIYGPWKYVCQLKVPDDNYWAIDLNLATINGKDYAVWSGWEHAEDLSKEQDGRVRPQNIYIAEFISPTEISERHLLLTPEGDWCSSVEAILEGPQALYIDGEFKGIVVTGNASWTLHYATKVLKYIGGDPLNILSWSINNLPLFVDGHGIGHGMIVHEGEDIYYVGHRKTSTEHGWADRNVFYAKINKEKFENFLKDEEGPFEISMSSPIANISDTNFDLAAV